MFALIITPGNGVWQWHLKAGACLRIWQVRQQVRAGLPSPGYPFARVAGIIVRERLSWKLHNLARLVLFGVAEKALRDLFP